MALPNRRWLDRTQPQTLYSATILLYLNAIFQVLNIVLYLSYGALSLLAIGIVAGDVIAAAGIANEKRWAYWLGVVMAFLPLVLLIRNHFAGGVLNLLFVIALIALLLHTQSRTYQRIWFK